ncbi:MAG: hypothetical protein ACJAU6_002841 [Alphaproteobacteria bacterium]|jgi:hypothetical protein
MGAHLFQRAGKGASNPGIVVATGAVIVAVATQMDVGTMRYSKFMDHDGLQIINISEKNTWLF